jgi:hypothetical protein
MQLCCVTECQQGLLEAVWLLQQLFAISCMLLMQVAAWALPPSSPAAPTPRCRYGSLRVGLHMQGLHPVTSSTHAMRVIFLSFFLSFASMQAYQRGQLCRPATLTSLGD